MIKSILQIILILFPFVLTAQETINSGFYRSIRSEILNEERNYWIYCPDSYNQEECGKASYPVLYLLDGEKNSFTQIAVQKALTNGLYRYMPEMIIVGIENTDRSRDLTPTKSQVVHQGKVIHTSSGGANRFLEFLTRELRPHMDSAYRTNGYNLLSGHSFGGLFTIYTLITSPQSFQAYIAHDPSLWWDGQTVFRQATEIWEQIDLSGTNLYVSFARSDEKEADKQLHSETIREFCTRFVKTNPERKFTANWEYFDQEDHGTIVLPASYSAMKNMFRGIRLPVKQIPENPSLIEKQYEVLSRQLNFTFIPEEPLTEALARYCEQTGNNESAKQLFEMNLKHFPGSTKARANLAKICLKMGDQKQSDSYYRQVLEINPACAVQLKKELEKTKQ